VRLVQSAFSCVIVRGNGSDIPLRLFALLTLLLKMPVNTNQLEGLR